MVYFGWGSVDRSSQVYKNLISVGTNPFFGDTARVIESHLLHDFGDDTNDFYGSELTVSVLAFIRPQRGDFRSEEELVKTIRCDIECGSRFLDEEPYCSLQSDPFFFVKPKPKPTPDEPGGSSGSSLGSVKAADGVRTE